MKSTEKEKSSVPPVRPTLGDVARRAGVSVMSASVTLNGGHANIRISESTRERIRVAAGELGYQVNSVARSLRKQRTHIIGFYGGYGFNRVNSPFTAELYCGLQLGCEEHKKDLLLHGAFHGGANSDDIYGALVGGTIDGLILLAPESDPLAKRLGDSGFPVVAVVDAISFLPSVVVDDARGGELLARHLIGTGHRQIAYLASESPRISQKRRMEACQRVVTEAGGAIRVCTEAPWKGEMTADDIAYLFSPTDAGGASAVICANDPLAEIMVNQYKERGFTVPRQKSVTGFDGVKAAFEPRTRLTTVRAPWLRVAEKGIELLSRRIEGDDIPLETVFPVTLVEGDSA